MIDLGRSIAADRHASTTREWIVTNGLGSYASGTVAQLLTRRYHGLLVAALAPPVGRTVLISKLEETASYGGADYPLYTNRWNHAGADLDPAGFAHIVKFRLEGTVPVWTFALADALLEKRVWMEQGENTTYVEYELVRGTGPVQLAVRAFANYRDFHTNSRSGDWRMHIEPVEAGVRVEAFEGATPFFVLCGPAEMQIDHTWYRDYFLDIEAYRGLDAVGDHLSCAIFEITLAPGASTAIVASTEAAPRTDGQSALERRHLHEAQLLSGHRLSPRWARQLVLAADQFVVERKPAGLPAGKSILAGYHWFGDWGRDTMISLPGLVLATGRHDIAASILRTFSEYVDLGMLPNRFPDAGEEPEYNSVDATLWYFEAIRAYHAATGDLELVDQLYPILVEIFHQYQTGTRYGIRVDSADGLVRAGEEGVQLTWMDAKVGDWVATPRIGKAVEVNALWYHALHVMGEFARLLDQPPESFERGAEQAAAGFGRFWNEASGYCYDVIDGPAGHDPALRPNQLVAVALTHSPLTREQQKAVVDVCAKYLLTSLGLRTLAPHDPSYVGHYGGAPIERDGAYHQGTVWPWLLGPFVSAHFRVYGDRQAALGYLDPLVHHLGEAGLGSISEIADGDPPHTPRGTIAQAWSVGEALRVWSELGGNTP